MHDIQRAFADIILYMAGQFRWDTGRLDLYCAATPAVPETKRILLRKLHRLSKLQPSQSRIESRDFYGQTERNYWLSFNIAPAGQTVSATTFKRGFLAEFADPQKPDLVFKQEYDYFNRKFREANEWDLFLPLHPDDKHFLTGLRFLSGDNQAEFDSQLISLTKLLVDSLNEKKIQEGSPRWRRRTKELRSWISSLKSAMWLVTRSTFSFFASCKTCGQNQQHIAKAPATTT